MGTDHVCRSWPNPAPSEAVRNLCSWIPWELDILNWCSDFFFFNGNPERLGMEIEFVHIGTNLMANLDHHMDFFHCLTLAFLYHSYSQQALRRRHSLITIHGQESKRW